MCKLSSATAAKPAASPSRLLSITLYTVHRSITSTKETSYEGDTFTLELGFGAPAEGLYSFYTKKAAKLFELVSEIVSRNIKGPFQENEKGAELPQSSRHTNPPSPIIPAICCSVTPPTEYSMCHKKKVTQELCIFTHTCTCISQMNTQFVYTHRDMYIGLHKFSDYMFAYVCTYT